MSRALSFLVVDLVERLLIEARLLIEDIEKSENIRNQRRNVTIIRKSWVGMSSLYRLNAFTSGGVLRMT